MDDKAPLNQTMKIQLDVWSVVNRNCSETPICSGTAPKAYHTNAVKPAQMAGPPMSRKTDFSLIICRNNLTRFLIAHIFGDVLVKRLACGKSLRTIARAGDKIEEAGQ